MKRHLMVKVDCYLALHSALQLQITTSRFVWSNIGIVLLAFFDIVKEQFKFILMRLLERSS